MSLLENYERLEFLGDAVLKLCISEILYKKFPEYLEGDLTKIRSIIVSDNILAEIAKQIGISELLVLGKNEEKTGGRERKSIIACAFEAILGAYYLEDKYTELSEVLAKIFASFIKDVDEHFEPHPEDAEKWQTAITAFGNVTKGSGIRTMTERAHSPWSQMYDTSFQRRVEDSDDTTLKDVFKEHLGEKGQHRYIASAPVGSFSQETENWKTIYDWKAEDTKVLNYQSYDRIPFEIAI